MDTGDGANIQVFKEERFRLDAHNNSSRGREGAYTAAVEGEAEARERAITVGNLLSGLAWSMRRGEVI